ncbi:MAG: hypothetical protein HYV63_14980 [Candidatus Schekmanbacteria bacterium]|nr:hypothetical protein [Candidatus Schekmanbacteria bacterium]
MPTAKVSSAPFLALAAGSLVVAIAGGLRRFGFGAELLPPQLTAIHGPLMVCGFLGTLISLERAAAIGSRWAFCAPAFCGLGAVALILRNSPVAWLLFTAGAVAFSGLCAAILRLQPQPFNVLALAGAVAWAAGTGLWALGWAVHQVVPLWVTFLVLTIGAERLQLARFQHLLPLHYLVFWAGAALLGGGAVAALTAPSVGHRVFGIGALGMAAWLVRYDIARFTLKQGGRPRFIAACLLSGYGWLGFSGVVFAVAPLRMVAGPIYDAALHGIFLGFVIAMIFGHAPIIFPSLTGRAIPYRRRFYGHLVLLHVSVLGRLASDLGDYRAAGRWFAVLNAVAIALFAANTLAAALAAERRGTRLAASPGE